MDKENLFKIPSKSLFCVESTIHHSFKLIFTHFISNKTLIYSAKVRNYKFTFLPVFVFAL